MPYLNAAQYPLEFKLHQKYAPSPVLLDLVWGHSNIVADVALQLYHRPNFNTTDIPEALILQACLLHDVGVYHCGGFEWIPDVNPDACSYAHHTVVGAWLLYREGFHPAVVQAAYCHAGVGLTRQDIQQFGLGLPFADYVPQSRLTQFLTYVGKFHSKAPHFKNNEAIKATLNKYGVEKVKQFETWEQEFGIPDLVPLEEKYKTWHEHMTSAIQQLNSQQLNQVNLSSAGISQMSQPLSAGNQPPMTLPN